MLPAYYVFVFIALLCPPTGLRAAPTVVPTQPMTPGATPLPTETPTPAVTETPPPMATASLPPVADSSSDDSGGGLKGNVDAVIVISAIFIALTCLSVLFYIWHINSNAGEPPAGCLQGIHEAFIFGPTILFGLFDKIGWFGTFIALLLPLLVALLSIVVAANGSADILAVDVLAFAWLAILFYEGGHVSGQPQYTTLSLYARAKKYMIYWFVCYGTAWFCLLFIIPGVYWDGGKTRDALGMTIFIAIVYGIPPLWEMWMLYKRTFGDGGGSYTSGSE